MKFGEFIKTIHKLKLISNTRDVFAAELFNSLDPVKVVYDTTVKPWIDKDKELKSYKKYFRNKVPSEAGFIDYLKSWRSLDWKRLRVEFCKICTDITIDCESDDEDIFYRSLFKQFIIILKFKCDTDASPTTESIVSETNESLQAVSIEQMLDVFSNLIYEYRIAEILSEDNIEPSMGIIKFVEVAKSEILNKFTRFQNETIYLKIREFIIVVGNYYHLCFAASHSCTDVLEIMHDKDESSNTFGKSALVARKEINGIYGEIFEGQTLYVC